MAEARVQWSRRDAPGLNSISLPPTGSVLIGRRQGATIRIDDTRVSRAHALITHLDGAWILEDVGSTGGTFLLRGSHRQRIGGRQELRDDDRICVGATVLRFRSPPEHGSAAFQPGTDTVRATASVIALTPSERLLLVALCADELRGTGGTPSNAVLADGLNVSLNTIRTVLKSLYRKFDLRATPVNQRRGQLVRRAIHEGWVDTEG